MTHRRLITLLTGLALALGIGAAGPAQAATTPLPVPYGFLPAAVIGGLGIDADPPGANDWACKPTRKHPRPVVLVHGFLGNKATNWQTFSPLLKNEGYCVYALTYGQLTQAPAPYDQVLGGLGDIRKSAAQVGAFIRKVRKAAGTSQVDIVAHSEGTVVPNYYAKFLGGAKHIKRYVSIAPPWHGTDPAALNTVAVLGTPLGVTPILVKALEPYAAAGPQLLAGSDFIKELRSGGTPVVKPISYTNILTRYDELVVPYSSGIQKGMTNYVIQDRCEIDLSDHLQIVSDPVTAAYVLNALDPAHPRPVPCQVVLPLVGTA